MKLLQRIFGSFWSPPKDITIKLKSYQICLCYRSIIAKNAVISLIPYPFISIGVGGWRISSYKSFFLGLNIIFFVLYIEIRKHYELEGLNENRKAIN